MDYTAGIVPFEKPKVDNPFDPLIAALQKAGEGQVAFVDVPEDDRKKVHKKVRDAATSADRTARLVHTAVEGEGADPDHDVAAVVAGFVRLYFRLSEKIVHKAKANADATPEAEPEAAKPAK